jgi:IS30 family transposase
MKYKGQLKEHERESIFLFLEQGFSYRKISEKIGRNHSVVLREINRNKGPSGKYQPFSAHNQAKERKIAANKLNPCKNPLILRYVEEKLKEEWSPQQISGRIKIDLPGHSICHETIYGYIYAKENNHLMLWTGLRRCKPRRMTYYGRKPQKEVIPNRIFIDKRPQYIKRRRDIGHWESDNMLGKKEPCGVSVTAERRSRFLVLGKLNKLTSEAKKDSLVASLGKLPPWMRKSITFDNGTENAKHELIKDKIKVNTYFCHPYHPYEKGTVENTIGLIRQYLPKKESLADITQKELNIVAGRINNRPRKCLGYKTPYEVFYGELSGAFRN